MQILLVQGGPRFTADGVARQFTLQFIIGVMGHVADPAAVHDGSFLFLGQEPMKFGVVAGRNDQGIDGPFITVDLDIAILDHPQVYLDQVFLILIDFVAEMNSAAGYPGQGAAS